MIASFLTSTISQRYQKLHHSSPFADPMVKLTRHNYCKECFAPHYKYKSLLERSCTVPTPAVKFLHSLQLVTKSEGLDGGCFWSREKVVNKSEEGRGKSGGRKFNKTISTTVPSFIPFFVICLLVSVLGSQTTHFSIAITFTDVLSRSVHSEPL